MSQKEKKHILLQAFIYLSAITVLFNSYIFDAFDELLANKNPDTKEIKADTTTHNHGVVFRKEIISSGKKRHRVRILELDATNPDFGITVLKAEDKINGYESILNMVERYEETQGDSIFGAINANYFRGRSYYPIGPTIQNGEVVYLSTIEKWSSAFFDENNRCYIDNFNMGGYIENSKGERFDIFNVNIRSKKDGIIIYNMFGGSNIPYISDRQAKARARHSRLSKASAKNLLIKKTHEIPRVKAICKYLGRPAVNSDIYLEVTKIDKGYSKVPEDGCIISFGSDFDKDKIPEPGDTILMRYTTNIYSDIVFYNAVCGTPRIVRSGVAYAETDREDLDNKRFIDKNMRRTAIGVNQDNTKIYFVIVETGSRSMGTIGASLDQLAVIMKKIGAWNAMNLDGGSSTAMVAFNKNKERIYRIQGTKLSVAAAFYKKSDDDRQAAK